MNLNLSSGFESGMIQNDNIFVVTNSSLIYVHVCVACKGSEKSNGNNTLKLEAFLSLTRIRISCALSPSLSLSTMNFFLSRDNERFRALENPRGRDTASSIEFISGARWDGEA